MQETSVWAVTVTSLLVACGGGGDVARLPPSADRSASEFLNKLSSLSGKNADSREPLDTSEWVAPASETTEPSPAN